MKNLNAEKQNIIKEIIKCVASFIFSVCSLLLSIWIGNSMAILFDSVLDKYLNYTISMLYLSASVINRIFFVIFLILFIVNIVKLIKHKKSKKNIIQIVSIIMFIIVNMIFLIVVITSQAQEIQVVDSIPVKSYVDIHEVFEISSDDESYTEQTNYGKVNSEIPVNYEVQQTTNEYSVYTTCVKITDNDLLYKYYEEQKEKCTYAEINEFNEQQLNEMTADKGCFWSYENSLNILIIKDGKIFKIIAEGSEINENYENNIINAIKTL